MDLLKKRKLEEHGSPPEPLSHDDLLKAIKPFTHEQLCDIVATASLRHADVLEAVRSIADQDISKRKLYITGLSEETTSQKLRQFFATYGDLELSRTYVRTIPTFTGSGYVTYKHIDGALRALKKRHKLIDGKMTVTQLASSAVVDQIPVRASTKGDSSGVAAPAAATTAKGGAVKPEVVNLNMRSSMQGCFNGGGGNGGSAYGGNAGQGPSVRHSQPVYWNSAATTAKVQVQGSSDAFKPEVVNSHQKSSTYFGGGGSNGVYDYGGNASGLGGSKFGYGGAGQGPSVGHSQPNLNSSRLPTYGINGTNTGDSSGLGLRRGPSSVSAYSSESDFDSDSCGLGLPRGPSNVSAFNGNFGGLGLLHGPATSTEVHVVHVPRSADMVKRELELVAKEDNVPRSGDRVKREALVDTEVHGLGSSGDRVKREVKQEVVDIEVHVPRSGDRVKREVKREVVDTEVHVPKSGDRVKLEVKKEVLDIEVHVPRSGDRVKREVKREVVNTNQQSEAMMDMIVRNGSDQSMRMSSEGYYNLSSDSDD